MFTFTAKGHANVLSTHRNTVEFTHETHLTLKGDCILGIAANYSLKEIQEHCFSGKIRITMKIGALSDEIIAEYNPGFVHGHEMVIRKTAFTDQRTFAIHANKAANDIKRELAEKMKNPKTVLDITIEQL